MLVLDEQEIRQKTHIKKQEKVQFVIFVNNIFKSFSLLFWKNEKWEKRFPQKKSFGTVGKMGS